MAILTVRFLFMSIAPHRRIFCGEAFCQKSSGLDKEGDGIESPPGVNALFCRPLDSSLKDIEASAFFAICLYRH